MATVASIGDDESRSAGDPWHRTGAHLQDPLSVLGERDAAWCGIASKEFLGRGKRQVGPIDSNVHEEGLRPFADEEEMRGCLCCDPLVRLRGICCLHLAPGVHLQLVRRPALDFPM